MDERSAGDERAAARARAELVAAEPGIVDRALAPRAGVGDPVPIVDPDGRHDRWFVPVVVDATLLGFVVLGRDLVVHRWSTFQRRPGSLDGCPEAAEWMDRERIAATAESVAGSAAPTASPVLSYDGAPDRLAWRVPLADGGVAWVAGSTAWRSPS